MWTLGIIPGVFLFMTETNSFFTTETQRNRGFTEGKGAELDWLCERAETRNQKYGLTPHPLPPPSIRLIKQLIRFPIR